MRKYGDLLDNSITLDSDIAKRIKDAIVQATKENNGEKADYNAVISKLVAPESKIEDSTLLYSQVQSLDFKRNDRIVFDHFYYIDLSEGKFHRIMDTLKNYIKPYLIDISAALIYNLEYDMVQDSDSIPLVQDYEKIADYSDNGVRKKCKYNDTEMDMETDERIYSMPFTLDSPENHSRFCEYTWRTIYKDEKNLKCFDLRTKNGNNQRTVNKIIDAISVDPMSLFKNIIIDTDDIQWLLDFFKIKDDDPQYNILKRKIQKLVFKNIVRVDIESLFNGYKKNETLEYLGIDSELTKDDIKDKVIDKVRTYLIQRTLEDISIYATQNDVWLIEKIFGCKAVLAFYPILNVAFDKFIELNIYEGIFFEIIKCRPIELRKQIAKAVSFYLQVLLYSPENENYNNSHNNYLYDKSKTDKLKIYLHDLVGCINNRYYSILRSLYDAIKNNRVVFNQKAEAMGTDIKCKVDGKLIHVADDLCKSIIESHNREEMTMVCEKYAINYFMGADYMNMKNMISQQFQQPYLKIPSISHINYKYAFLQTIAIETSFKEYHSK